jgi:hypothetical protein
VILIGVREWGGGGYGCKQEKGEQKLTNINAQQCCGSEFSESGSGHGFDDQKLKKKIQLKIFDQKLQFTNP